MIRGTIAVLMTVSVALVAVAGARSVVKSAAFGVAAAGDRSGAIGVASDATDASAGAARDTATDWLDGSSANSFEAQDLEVSASAKPVAALEELAPQEPLVAAAISDTSPAPVPAPLVRSLVPAPTAAPAPAPVSTARPIATAAPAQVSCPATWFCYPRLGIAAPIVPYTDCSGSTDVGTAIRSYNCLSETYLMGHAYTQFGLVRQWAAGDVVFAWGKRYTVSGASTQQSCGAPVFPLAPLSMQTSLTSSACGAVLVVQAR